VYDFFSVGADRLFVLVADVSGKGVPAGLATLLTKSLYKSAVLRTPDDIVKATKEVNLELSRDGPESFFVTAFAALLNAETGRLEYCVAGCEPPLLVAARGRPVECLTAIGGPPLAVLNDFPYEAASRQMQPGETLVVCTDGVTEALDPSGALYGKKRLSSVLEGVRRTAGEIGHAVRRDLKEFAAGINPTDDLTILVLRWNGPTKDWKTKL